MAMRLTQLMMRLVRSPRTRRRRLRRAVAVDAAVLEDRLVLATSVPVMDGIALDNNNDGVFDSVSATGLVDVRKSATFQAVGLFEFVTPGPAASEPGVITGITNLRFPVNYFTGAPQLKVYAYAGNGQLDLSDATAAGTLIATTSGSGLSNITPPPGLIATLGNPTHIGIRVETNQGQVRIYGVDQYPSNSDTYAAKLDYSGVYLSPQETIIDFSRLQHAGIIADGNRTIPSYSTQDQYYHGSYQLVGGFSVYGSASDQYSGSAAAASRTLEFTPYPQAYILSRPDGLPFTLKSMKLAKDAASSPDARVVFTGTKADGTTVVQGGTADRLQGRQIDFAGLDDVVSVGWWRPGGGGVRGGGIRQAFRPLTSLTTFGLSLFIRVLVS